MLLCYEATYLDDALGYPDPERLKLMGAVLAVAARECRIVIFLCVPERYAFIGGPLLFHCSLLCGDPASWFLLDPI